MPDPSPVPVGEFPEVVLFHSVRLTDTAFRIVGAVHGVPKTVDAEMGTPNPSIGQALRALRELPTVDTNAERAVSNKEEKAVVKPFVRDLKEPRTPPTVSDAEAEGEEGKASPAAKGKG